MADCVGFRGFQNRHAQQPQTSVHFIFCIFPSALLRLHCQITLQKHNVIQPPPEPKQRASNRQAQQGSATTTQSSQGTAGGLKNLVSDNFPKATPPHALASGSAPDSAHNLAMNQFFVCLCVSVCVCVFVLLSAVVLWCVFGFHCVVMSVSMAPCRLKSQNFFLSPQGPRWYK